MKNRPVLWVLLTALIALACLLLVAVLKVVALAVLAASVGYLVDRVAFQNAQPHLPLEAATNLPDSGSTDALEQGFLDQESLSRRRHQLELLAAAYMARRALILAACVHGFMQAL